MKQIGNTHAEYFAGVGGVSVGLNYFNTIWANDISPLKQSTFLANHPEVEFVCKDLNLMAPNELPTSTLASVTLPCTNTSCAGDRTGLLGVKSGVIYRWIELIRKKGGSKNHNLTLLENPTGLIARNKGKDLSDLVGELNALGYAANLMVVDAKHFVPQSRPRIFISCFDKAIADKHLRRLSSVSDIPDCKEKYPNPLKKWIGDNLHLDLIAIDTAPFPVRTLQLEDIIDLEINNGKDWATNAFKNELVSNLVGVQLERFTKLVNSPEMTVSTIARRGRKDEFGVGFNATEISLSGLAPAQRPYSGGSSRCWILVAGKGQYNFKVVTARESARLMGFPDSFILPENDKEAYQCTGDSVCPQAVTWVEDNIFKPIFKKMNQTPKPIMLNQQFTFEF